MQLVQIVLKSIPTSANDGKRFENTDCQFACGPQGKSIEQLVVFQ